MKIEKRSQFFVGGDDESLSVVAVCISNEDRLSVGINRCDAAPTPTGFAEIVSDDFGSRPRLLDHLIQFPLNSFSYLRGSTVTVQVL